MWVLDLLALGVAAALAAHATALAAGAALLRRSMELAPSPLATPLASVAGPDVRGEAIVRRNIFCSSCRTRSSPERAEAKPASEVPSPLRLLAIMYAAPPADGRQSLAVIKDQRGATGAYAVGSLVGNATVDAIAPLRVSLHLPGGDRWYLTLLDGQSHESSPKVAPVDSLSAELDAGITKVGDNRYGVRRATIESLLGKMDALPSQARLEPDIRDGKAVGFRLRDVRAGGVFAKIGLRDGDLVSSVNGLATNGPDNALAIYASLRSARHLSVALERSGRRITTEYDIE